MDEHPLPAAHGVGGPGMISGDRACRACGYNLRGLRVGGPCPECGMIIRRASVKDRPLASMPKPIIRLVLRGVATLWAAWAVTAGGAVAAYLYVLGLPSSSDQAWLAGATVGMAALMTAAAWLATPTIEHEAAAERGYTKRDRIRLIARWMMPAWIGATGAILTGALLRNAGVAGAGGMAGPGGAGAARPLLDLAFAVCATAGAMGLGALLLHLERAAEWTRDDLAERLANIALWTLPGPLALIGWCIVLGNAGLTLLGLPVGVAVIFLTLSVIVGSVLLLVLLASLTGAVRTCLRHADEYAERDRRRRERDQREAAKMDERMAGL